MAKYIKNLKIRTKLLLGFLVVILLVMVIGVGNNSSLRQAQDNFVEFNEDIVSKMAAFSPFKDSLHMAIIAAYEYVQTDDAAAKRRAKEMLQNAEIAKRDFSVLTEHTLVEKNFAHELDTVSNEVRNEINTLFKIYDERRDEKAVAQQVIKVRESQMRAMMTVHNDIDNFIKGERKNADGSNRRFLSSAIYINVFLSIFIFFIGIGLALLISYMISKPLLNVRDAADEIARGNLDKVIEVNTTDEVGQLASSFNRMIVKLRMSYEGLEMKVKEKTNDLTKALLQLKEQNTVVEKEKENVLREKDKIDSILHSIGDGVFVIDTRYRITIFNQVAANISGFSVEEALGNKYNDILKFIYEKDGKVNDKFIKEAMATGEIKEMLNHTLLVRKDGDKVAVVDSAAPLKDKAGKVSGCVIVFRDVGKEREIDRAKSEFVSLASHQLRTPLTAIKWEIEILLAEQFGRINKGQKKYLEKLYHASQRMIDLVNALLNVSRIELGTLAIESEPINLFEIADSVLDELSAQIKEKELQIEKSYDKNLPIINADPQLMRIVFQNLLSNSVKYTPDSGTISLTIEKKEPNVLIKVSDNGYGIPRVQQSQIFKKLFRADNIKSKDPDGTGLGLYIVKSVVEQSGGKIWFESKENKGTTFYVVVPLSGVRKKEGKKLLT